jgi:hypothetical protein
MSTFLGRLAERVRGTGPKIKPLPATPFSPRFYAGPGDHSSSLKERGEAAPTMIPEVGMRRQRRPAEGRENAGEHTERLGGSFVSGWPRDRSKLYRGEGFDVEIKEPGSHKEVTKRNPEVASGTLDLPHSLDRTDKQTFRTIEANTWMPSAAPATANPHVEDYRAKVPSEEGALPNVYVTIGRIEVRSVASKNEQERTERRGARAPRVTLEEYLRKRNEGRR